MKKCKIMIISILIFLVMSIFYREIKLKKIESEKNIKISNEIKVLEKVLEENNEIEKKIDVKTEIKTETLETTQNLVDKNLENQISKEWKEQEVEITPSTNKIINLEKIILKDVEYTIKKGDTISDLSKEYKIKSDYIYANNVDKNLRVLQVGKKINIPTESGIFYIVKKGDTFEGLSKRFDVDIKKIKQDNTDRLLIGTKIFLREPKVSKYLTSFKEEYIKQTTYGTFINPLSAMTLTSKFGTRKHPVLKKVLNHAGIDLRAKTGTKVVSVKEGVVSFAGRASGYGKLIIIKHSNGYETRYAHLSKMNVKKGQKISQNQEIALSGATGRVSGPHLHFEIRRNGKVQNPMTYLKF
ncbi:MAG: peptidoglycan DD-metalloendopeptidase family protein [Cetobacterium sp.]